MSERHKSGQTLKWAGGGLAALVLLLALCLAFLQTDMAREKLAAALSASLSTDDGVRVTFGDKKSLCEVFWVTPVVDALKGYYVHVS